MGKMTGRRRKLNYRPILYVAAVAVPVIVIATILTWPKKPVPLQFEAGPDFEPHLSARGTFRIHWQTNAPARGTVYYRFADDRPYDEMPTRLDTRGGVALPAAAGQTIEFYVEVAGLRGTSVKSETFRVPLLAPQTSSATAPAGQL